MPFFFIEPGEDNHFQQKQKIYYSDTERGKDVLVFIHGWFLDSSVFRPIIEALKGTYRVLAIDLPGHGQSSKGYQDETNLLAAFRATRQLVELAREKEGTRTVTLIGHSVGSFLALKMSLFYSKQVDQLVLISPLVEFSSFESNVRKLEKSGNLMLFIKLWVYANFAHFPFNGLTQSVFPPNKLDFFRRNAHFFRLVKNHPLHCARQYIFSFRNVNIEPVIKNNNKPTLLIYGKQDYFTETNMGSHYAKSMSHTVFETVDQAGHGVLMTQPLAVQELIKGFLQETLRKRNSWLRLFSDRG